MQLQGVSYVWYSANEQALGAWSPAGASYLRLVFESPDVAIYQVADTL
jgi:hypothetical protein